MNSYYLKEMKSLVFKFSLCLFILISFSSVSIAQSSINGVFERTPVRQNLQIYQQAINKISNDIDKANDEYQALLLELSEYLDKLNNDKETLSWFNDYKQSITDSFNSMVKFDPAGARNYCIKMKGEVALNSELRARVRTSEEYKEEMRYIKYRSDLSEAEKKEYIENHPYVFIPIYDDDHKVIGGRLGTKQELNEMAIKRLKELDIDFEEEIQVEKKDNKTQEITVETKLKQLETLRKNGRISDEAYNRFRNEIINEQ